MPHAVTKDEIHLCCSPRLRVSAVKALPRGKWQQRNIPRPLDRRRQSALVRCAYSSEPTRHDLPPLRHKLPEQTHVLIVNVVDLFHAELADLFAPEKFPSAAALTSTGSTIWSRTIRPSAAVRPWRWC